MQTKQDNGLSNFLAAMGGAVLGMLLTLFVLAIINGGTLNFVVVSAKRDDAIMDRVVAIDKNLGATIENVRILAEKLDAK